MEAIMKVSPKRQVRLKSENRLWMQSPFSGKQLKENSNCILMKLMKKKWKRGYIELSGYN